MARETLSANGHLSANLLVRHTAVHLTDKGIPSADSGTGGVLTISACSVIMRAP